jgi:hypothetical protein
VFKGRVPRTTKTAFWAATWRRMAQGWIRRRAANSASYSHSRYVRQNISPRFANSATFHFLNRQATQGVDVFPHRGYPGQRNSFRIALYFLAGDGMNSGRRVFASGYAGKKPAPRCASFRSRGQCAPAKANVGCSADVRDWTPTHANGHGCSLCLLYASKSVSPYESVMDIGDCCVLHLLHWQVKSTAQPLGYKRIRSSGVRRRTRG